MQIVTLQPHRELVLERCGATRTINHPFRSEPMKNTLRKLTLHKITVRLLEAADLRAAAAGINPTAGQGQSCAATCTNNDTVSKTQ